MSRRTAFTGLAAVEAAALFIALVLGLSATRAAASPPRSVAAPVVVAPTPIAVVTAPQPVVRKAAPKPVKKAVVRKKRVAPRTPTVRRTTARRTTTTARPQLTGRLLMLAAVARIPGYDGSATWVMTDKYGSWGTADWYRGTAYISPRVPASKMFDVVSHEWAHLVSVKPYASVSDAMAGMNKVFGGSGLTGAERAADCMARKLGAAWTHYTSCGNSDWQAAAARLLAGQQA